MKSFTLVSGVFVMQRLMDLHRVFTRVFRSGYLSVFGDGACMHLNPDCLVDTKYLRVSKYSKF